MSKVLVKYKGNTAKTKIVEVTKNDWTTYKPILPNVVKENKPAPKRKLNQRDVEGVRVKEIKRIGSDEGKGQEYRVSKLTKLAHELGPEKLLNEIETHKRKISDLEGALTKYYEEGGK